MTNLGEALRRNSERHSSGLQKLFLRNGNAAIGETSGPFATRIVEEIPTAVGSSTQVEQPVGSDASKGVVDARMHVHGVPGLRLLVTSAYSTVAVRARASH